MAGVSWCRDHFILNAILRLKTPLKKRLSRCCEAGPADRRQTSLHLRVMFADEARFGRMNCPRPCWAPIGTRPQVASQLVREYVYLYGAVSPKDGTCVYLIMPAPDTECF